MADWGKDTPVPVARLSSSCLRVSVLHQTAVVVAVAVVAAVAVAAADVDMAAAAFRC